MLWIGAGVALAYAALGRLSLLLAIPPGYASPLYPSAGVALAALLVYGRPMLPAVFAGAFAINLWSEFRHGVGAAEVGVAFAIGVASSLQAWAGAALIRRFVRQPLTLAEPRDIALFYLVGAAVACAVSSSLSCVALWMAGRIGPHNATFTWLTWWVGDAMGTLVAAPVALTLIGRPRDDWAHRRLNVGVTLTLATLLVAAMVMLVSRWNTDRARSNFEREASAASSALITQLVEPIRALEALRSVEVARPNPSREEFERGAQAWTETPVRLQALGYAARVPASQESGFVEKMHGTGVPAFRIFDRPDMPSAPPQDSVIGDDRLPITYVAPLQGNTMVLGLDLHSVPPSRAAIQHSVLYDEPAASEGFTLFQHGMASGRISIVVYQALYDGTPRDRASRLARFRGLVFVSIDVEKTLQGGMSRVPSFMRMCLVDVDPKAAHARLFGPEGCEQRSSGPFMHVESLNYAERQLEVRAYAEADHGSIVNGVDAWLFSLVGLMAASVLGALLLAVTGRTRSISVAVRERTSALELEVRERLEAESALRLSEQRFRNVFDTMPLGLVYQSMDGRIQQANPRIAEMTGFAPEELVGRHAASLAHHDDMAEAQAFFDALVEGAIPLYSQQLRFIRKTGQEIWVRTAVSALRDENGRARHIVTVVEDITERIRLEEAERAREAAEASNRAKSDFLSRMSHELRTPLNAMLGFAQLLELDAKHAMAGVQREWVGQIQQAGWHLLEMINDILDLSRIESGTLRLAMVSLEVPTVLGATLPLIEASARQRNISISRDLDPEALRVRGDSTRVKQILTNLLSNAVKYNKDDGLIHLRSRAVGDRVEITVSDTGLGMTQEQLADLFKPFNRLGRERSQVEGTGIGLVISQRLALLMNGSLVAHSVVGKGSSFVLSLPIVNEDPVVPSELDQLAEQAPGYHRRVVHYVEDNETNVEVMRGILAQRPQVRMEVSTNGLDGLAAIAAAPPDLVLLDMHLPDISGMELLAFLKEQPATAGIPVVAVSADALESQIATVLAAGADRYLTKPVSVSELLGVVDELLGSAQTRFG